MAEGPVPCFAFSVREFIGSLGDLGTLLPLTVGLIAHNGIDPARALILLGVTYVLIGVYYRLPVPVQPLKATAMIAIAVGASRAQIAAAALWIAGILIVLSLTRAIDKLNEVFPRVLVRGLQFGLGVLMVRAGLRFVLSHSMTLGDTLGGVQASASDGLLSVADFRSALVLLVLPQIPLTLGNAVLATRDCARKYFGSAGERVTPAKLSITIALGNIAAGLFGGVPMCHGAGGMTAHYRLGARTGAAGVMIGAVLIAGGIAGRHSLSAISAIPASVLGVLLLYVGVRHAALAGAELRRPATAAVVLGMGAISIVNSNMLLVLAVGLAVKAALLDAPRLLRRSRRQSR